MIHVFGLPSGDHGCWRLIGFGADGAVDRPLNNLESMIDET
ncbi:hypothetical protein [Roseococcus microcysteis]|nr:hypothetical protein [Roseococcus microcysteis]